MYVEHLFRRSDNADAPYISKDRLLKIDATDARSVQKTPAGVLVVRRGLFFVKRQRRYPPICKRLHLKLSDLCRKVLNTLLILLTYGIYFLYGIADLHGTGCHLIHAVGDNTRQFV